MEANAFGDMVRTAREQKGLRAYELAPLIGKQPSFVSRLETGVMKETPTPDVLAALHEHLGLDETAMLRALGYLAGSTAPPPVPRVDAEVVERLCKAVEAVPDWSAAEGMAGSLLQILMGIRSDQLKRRAGTQTPPLAGSVQGR